MTYPDEFRSAKRWMVRPNGKQSVSAYETRPIGYEPPAEGDPSTHTWRYRWSTPSVLATYADAKSYWDRHADTIEGLTFVLHHFGDLKPTTRIVCIDFDEAVDENGKIDPDVSRTILDLDSWTERSKSGDGLHTFVLVSACPAFANCIRRRIGGCFVDVLLANPVNVTGETLDGFTVMRTISYEDFQKFDFFDYKAPTIGTSEHPDWWSEDPLTDVPDHLHYLIEAMQSKPAIEGEGGSKVLFAAACRLARHGVVGREAESLLRCVPAIPPFPADQIQRTIERAYSDVGSAYELPHLAGSDEDSEQPDRESLYGFHFFSMQELESEDLRLEYLVHGAFVGEGALFIGGCDKTFKTGIAADLIISLATKTPFLGHFPVLDNRSAVFFTAEIGMARAKQLLTSICAGRGMRLRDVDGVDISEIVPAFVERTPRDVARRQKLVRYFRDRKPQVAVFDPLYFAMAGSSNSDMYEIADILRNVTEVCRTANVWPIFCHHSRKNLVKEYAPMELSDFYGAGIGAFARQWILLSHAEPFRGGVAKLYGNIGGSSQGARGVYDIQIDEGQSDEIADRRWDVSVTQTDADRGVVSRESILAKLDGLPPVTAAELSVHLDCAGREPVIKKILYDLVRDSRVQMVNKKFALSLGGF